MSVESGNRYAFLMADDENEDPNIIAAKFKAQQQEAEKAKKEAAAAAAAERQSAPRTDRQSAPRTDRPRGDRPTRGRGGIRGDRPPRTERPPATTGEDAPAFDKEKRPYSGRGGRGGARGGRREDRHSHSTRKDTEKGDTIGKGNWGKPVDTEADKEIPAVASEENLAEKVETPAPEEEDKTQTLDEYLASMTRASLALPEARKANEGVDDKLLKNSTVLKKVEEDFFAATKTAKAKRVREEKKKAELIEIEPMPLMSSQPREERRGGRGGRRGGDRNSGRGGRSSGDNRRKNEAAPVIDEASFPSL